MNGGDSLFTVAILGSLPALLHYTGSYHIWNVFFMPVRGGDKMCGMATLFSGHKACGMGSVRGHRVGGVVVVTTSESAITQVEFRKSEQNLTWAPEAAERAKESSAECKKPGPQWGDRAAPIKVDTGEMFACAFCAGGSALAAPGVL